MQNHLDQNQNLQDDRRGFLKNLGITLLGASALANVSLDNYFLGSKVLAKELDTFKIEGKKDVIYHGQRPMTAETQIYALDSDFTKPENFFVRNNGIPPELSVIKEKMKKGWTLEIGGESVKNAKTYTLDELKKKFKHYTYALTLECGGNGRGEVIPSTKGTQWGYGAVACGRWTGVRLKDILEDCGIKDDAVYIGYYGIDTKLNGEEASPISRGVPMKKAMQDETLIAWAYEGKDIPWINGYPLRLVCGGYPASASGKWLSKIVVRNKVHDGEKMETSYKVPVNPVKPGDFTTKGEMKIIESMPVKSIITNIKNNDKIKANKKFEVRGKAWAGELEVSEVYVSNDYGVTWTKAKVEKPLNRLAWQKWSAQISIPTKGYYEIWARAIDNKGNSQPMVLAQWNPNGYINNACHRVNVFGV
ncbi:MULTISPECIES: molybdenum-containing sulfite:cytochrome c oxidoreductase, monoheme cytochrome c subunit [Campylobacter]|uniref:Molybdenum-containing sulfite:cytochrome c oxidoreductase, monoheme cytochrome c subunit n=1 Tax=Campylobacter peloridis TaxID=488546 RepID=A0A5C7DMY1_9BACT|nr:MULTISPECIES: molybdenum-containing sulfite:cytochrome c oxidoreductase, monoheme cytochrome c subunit [Campylobacter]AJC83881.1 molybdenum-containing sulfite:cytochrome c oxidoreductase SorAB, monoheme cytochrome c subunit [Campylobacter peloridis LMG 23910]MBX1886309.1 molybdenum-containing sulfite:cytochrome c oxidoreductase, monoheme cytochrome c subunit [Campylobacter peloridis]MCV3356120.1 molybdenum-containing sulfite:cytochrome c oxidoreductase, monoheme cytochrome c subunit [Campylob